MKRICVYCGSSVGNRPEYATAARQLADVFIQQDMELVYGGASVGIMGILADAVLEQGGKVTGVIPDVLVDMEVAHTKLTELIVVHSMHERKALMAELSDAFIALPGGLGTLEELFEMLTWNQLGIYHKPCGVLNVDGYFDSLLQFLDNAVEQGYVSKMHRALLMEDSDIEPLLQKMKTRSMSKSTFGLDVSNT